MSSIWRKFQRINKRASKYRFICVFNQLTIEGTSKWQPHKLSISLNRRRRKFNTTSRTWEPTIRNPYRGVVIWPTEEGIEMTLTLFRGPRETLYEEKYYNLVIEETTSQGKCKQIAFVKLDLAKFANDSGLPCHEQVSKLSLVPISKKVVNGDISISISCQFIKEGLATDEDMISIASLLSMQAANEDIGNLKDFEDPVNQNQPSAIVSNELSQLVNEINNFANLSAENRDDTSNGENSKAINSRNMTSHDSINPKPIAGLASTAKCPDSNSTKNAVIGGEAQNDENTSSSYECSEESNAEAGKTIECNNLPRKEVKVDSKFDDFDENELESILGAQQYYKESNLKDNESSNLDLHGSVTDKTTSDEVTAKTTITNTNDETDASVTKFDSALNEADALSSLTTQAESWKECPTSDDLLNWCKTVTANYPGVRVTNMTTSWRNGMAFLAILHHFCPDMVDFNSLSPSNIKGNCKKAFDSFASFGIPPVIDPNDMARLNIPDKLSVITYLHQLKEFFTQENLQTISQGYSTSPNRNSVNSRSPTIVKSNSSDNVHEDSIDHGHSELDDDEAPVEFSFTRFQSKNWKTRRNAAKNNSENPQNDSSVVSDSRSCQLTQLDSTTTSHTSESPFISPINLSSKNMSRTKPQVSLIPKLFAEPRDEDESLIDSSKNAKLREKARQLIADAKNRTGSLDSSGKVEFSNDSSDLTNNSTGTFAKISPVRSRPFRLPTTRSLDSGNIKSSVQFVRFRKFGSGEKSENNDKLSSTPVAKKEELSAGESAESTTQADGPTTTEMNESPVTGEIITNSDHSDNNHSSYAKKELEELEKEQQLIDAEAASLEKKLRMVMREGESKEVEEEYLKQWFNLVNKKNELIRRQMQLNLLDQEQDLELRYSLLNDELRTLLEVQDQDKTEAQKEKEKSLLDELLIIVEKRNQLVQRKDCYDEDDEVLQSVVNEGQINQSDTQANAMDLLAAGTAVVDKFFSARKWW